MNAWQQVIQIALIGTDKQTISTKEMDEDLLPAIDVINSNTAINREEQFLQIATLIHQYTFCGTEASIKTDSSLPICEAETQSYCNTSATNVLRDILYENSDSLLKLWLQLCTAKQQIVVPELLPILFDKLVQQKELQTYIACLGKRGVWLSQFKSEWNFVQVASDEELWLRGTTDQRKKVLQHLRNTNTILAREWLQATWGEENAATKQQLLQALTINLSEDDVTWLESLTTEKSSKVKEDVLALLQQITSATIVQQYASFLQQSLVLKKEKTMFGLSSKQVLQIEVPNEVATQMVKHGLENLSNKKGFSDEEWMVYQLVEHVPPKTLEQYLQLSPQSIIELLQKEEATTKLITAVVSATVRFSSKEWAIALMQFSNVFYLDILPLLPMQQQEYYSKKFFKGHEQSIIHYASSRTQEWSLELTQLICNYAAANPYNYSKSFFNQQIHLIPTQAITVLNNDTLTEGYAKDYWTNTKTYVEKLLTIKQQTIQSFQ